MSSLSPATYKLPFFSYLESGALAPFGSFPLVLITAAINASGVNTFCEASNDPEIPNLILAESNPKTSPSRALVCCITIPPSPAEVDPEANLINLSATSKSSVCWNEAVPNTVKFLEIVASLVTVKSCPIVTSSGKPIVTVSVVAVLTSTSLAVPANVKVSVCRSIAWGFEPSVKFNVVAIPVNPEPSPSNEPLNDPEAVSPEIVVRVSPKATVSFPIVILSFTNWALVIVSLLIWPAIVSAVIVPPKEISWPAIVIPSFTNLAFVILVSAIPIVIVWAEADASIPFAPAKSNVCVSKSIVVVVEPSPPTDRAPAAAEADSTKSIIAALVAIVVSLSLPAIPSPDVITRASANFANVTPPSFTCSESEAISIVESSTCTSIEAVAPKATEAAEIPLPLMCTESFANDELGIATKSNVNVSEPALATIFKPVEPDAKFNEPEGLSANSSTPLIEPLQMNL